MAAQTSKAPGDARQRRVKLAGETIDRIDIARHLIMAEPVSCRLALAMRLLRTTVDDVAELAGIEDEKERQAEAIKRAAAPLPVKRRTIWQKLDAAAFVGIVGTAMVLAAAWIGASVAIRAGWL